MFITQWVNEMTQQTPFDVLIGHTLMIQMEKTNMTIPKVTRQKEGVDGTKLTKGLSRTMECTTTPGTKNGMKERTKSLQRI
jgi:hypothetical protein